MASKPFKCQHCTSDFAYKRNLTAHERKKHNILVKSNFLCNICGIRFNFKHNLKAHEHKKHNIIDTKSEKIKNFECSYCKRKSVSKTSLSAHIRKYHKSIVKLYLVNCKLCSFSASKKDVIKHFTNSHGINVVSESLKFKDFNGFQTWKACIETEMKTKFIKGSSSKKLKIKHSYYICHRSGYFVSEGKGLRRIRRQGTKKINGFCPASIILRELQDGSCEVNFTKTHVGHETEVENLNLVTAEQGKIAGKLSELPLKVELNEDSIGINNNNNNNIVKTESNMISGEEENLSTRKQKLKKHFLEFLNTVTLTKQIDAVERVICSFKPTLDVVSESSMIQETPSHDKKIEQQCNFTLKPDPKAIRIKHTNQTVCKPSSNKSLEIALSPSIQNVGLDILK